jgi:hypothetical protein
MPGDSVQHKANYRRLFCGGVVIVLLAAGSSSSPQSQPSIVPHPILLPQANRLPDVNDQMVMRQSLQSRENFDAANELRHKQISDDSTKLLILARDLKAKMDALEGKPVPEQLQREAEVIELLAHDVQTRMVLTVNGD